MDTNNGIEKPISSPETDSPVATRHKIISVDETINNGIRNDRNETTGNVIGIFTSLASIPLIITGFNIYTTVRRSNFVGEEGLGIAFESFIVTMIAITLWLVTYTMLIRQKNNKTYLFLGLIGNTIALCFVLPIWFG